MLFETAVIEVAGNIVRHGRSPNGFRCRVTIGVYDTALEALFEDTADEIDPAAIDPAAIDPAAIDPAAIDPAAIDPAAIDPAAIDPAAVDPAAVDPVLDSISEGWLDEMADHGRGLALARAAVDELTYQRVDGVNQWRVRRVRTG
jgi:anti-sigma regulatory factor (Ser/Thr protein kinase)